MPITLEVQEKAKSQAEEIDRLVSEPITADTLLRGRDQGAGESTWMLQLGKLAVDIEETLPQGTDDLELRLLLSTITKLRLAMPSALETGKYFEVEVLCTDVHNIVERLNARTETERLREPAAAAAFVFDKLRDVASSKQLAAILGVSDRTISAWRGGATVSRNADRVRLVAELVRELDFQVIPSGLAIWFEQPIQCLGGETPVEMMDEDLPRARRELLQFVGEGSDQLGI